MYQSILRPLLFRCDPEWVHNQAIRQAEFFGAFPPGLSLLSRGCGYSDDRLATEVCGLRFSNPIGLAAGYDKSGRVIILHPPISLDRMSYDSSNGTVDYRLKSSQEHPSLTGAAHRQDPLASKSLSV